MTRAELDATIKKVLTSSSFDSKKYSEVKTLANERCNDYISNQAEKNSPSYVRLIDFTMESLYYSAIEEAVNATINALTELGILQVDD